MRETRTPEPSQTDWARVDKMAEADMDFLENPPLDKDFWAEAICWPGPKKQITLRLDIDVLDFFKKHGKGYQTAINSVLRQYMSVHEGEARRS
jgi:uncharacterized protein (DUF4415 family)